MLQATCGNAAKQLRNRQETRVTTRAGRTAEAAIKQIASQELQVEKVRIKEWKKKVMEDVLHIKIGGRTLKLFFQIGRPDLQYIHERRN